MANFNTQGDFATMMHSNPTMNSAISPYISKFQRFVFNSTTMADTFIHPLVNSSFAVELLIVCARTTNSGTVQLWNENIGTAIGFTLTAGSVWVQTIDNNIWDFAEALVKVLGKPNQINPFKRQALDTTQWKVQASAATQIVDVVLAMGPNNE